MSGRKSVDLHVHSCYSDGKLTPDELAVRARVNNVIALAITDHDTMAGTDEKLEACRRYDIECVFGVELSCELAGRETHILSLFADPDADCLDRIARLSGGRRQRMVDMLKRLARLGIMVEMADLPVAEDGVYGRPHLARALVAKGVVRSVNEAFGRYLYDGGPVHINKTRLPAEEGIELAKSLGGVAVVAHPGVSGLLDDLDALVGMGLDGVEVYHPKHGGETIAKLLRYCRDRGVLVSGGSDFHAPGDGADIGGAKAPVDLLEPLRELAATRKG